MIVSKNINDSTITNKLLNLSVKLDNDNKVLGYLGVELMKNTVYICRLRWINDERIK